MTLHLRFLQGWIKWIVDYPMVCRIYIIMVILSIYVFSFKTFAGFLKNSLTGILIGLIIFQIIHYFLTKKEEIWQIMKKKK